MALGTREKKTALKKLIIKIIQLFLKKHMENQDRSVATQSKLLIENTWCDKFYHCFRLQIIHKSIVTHFVLFNLWSYIESVLFHRNYFQPKKNFQGIFTVFGDKTSSPEPRKGASAVPWLNKKLFNKEGLGDTTIRPSMLCLKEEIKRKGWQDQALALCYISINKEWQSALKLMWICYLFTHTKNSCLTCSHGVRCKWWGRVICFSVWLPLGLHSALVLSGFLLQSTCSPIE